MPAFNDGFLDLPERPGKPRAEGLTHVIDKGLNMRDVEGLFDTAGRFVSAVPCNGRPLGVAQAPPVPDGAFGFLVPLLRLTREEEDDDRRSMAAAGDAVSRRRAR